MKSKKQMIGEIKKVQGEVNKATAKYDRRLSKMIPLLSGKELKGLLNELYLTLYSLQRVEIESELEENEPPERPLPSQKLKPELKVSDYIS